MKFEAISEVLKNGETIVIRMAMPEDAPGLLAALTEYLNDAEYFLTIPSEFNLTVEQVREWILSFLNNMNSLLLIATHNDEIIGNIDVTGSVKSRTRHTAIVAMGIKKNWRNTGLGSAMMKAVVNWAIQHPVIEKLWLQLFHANETALALYKKFGFREEGKQLDFFKKEDGSYYHNLIMALGTKTQ